MSTDKQVQQKKLEVVAIELPPESQQVQRNATFAAEGERRTRYSLPTSLRSTSPVGYRTRLPMTEEEVQQALHLLSLERPSGFAPSQPVTEQELFEECSLGVLSSRQSTNYRGHEQKTLGPEQSKEVAALLREMQGQDAAVLDGASYTHVLLSRPYRTPFTLLLTMVGHKPLLNLFTVPLRALRKQFQHITDIPTIGYLQDLHIGILAESIERAAVVASAGRRRAQVHMAPFCDSNRKSNQPAIRKLEALCGLTWKQRMQGWRIALVAQVGEALEEERVALEPNVARKLGANMLAFRSERIQPGVNQEEKAPSQYQSRQDMDVPDELTVMAGRASYNAFAHWTGVERERAKDLLLLERIDVLTPGGKDRLRSIRQGLNDVTDRVIKDLPLWIDLPTGKLFSRNANRGRKAFALAGQRIYLGGLSHEEMNREGIGWELAIRAVGAVSARSALYSELMGVLNLPESCDLLAGMCMMAGPVNQNDIGKEFYGDKDLLHPAYPDRNPTTLLVWTLKAKTVADPIGNEEQLLNAKRKGALVDLRLGPHEAVTILQGNQWKAMRLNGVKTSEERAFGDQSNFVTDPNGQPIPGNEGKTWPTELSQQNVW